eukprot:435443_1
MSTETNPQTTAPQQSTIDAIVRNAMKEHKRRKSQFTAIRDDLGLVFDKEDLTKISRDVMKQIFAQKHNKQQYWQEQKLEQGYAEHMKQQIETIQNEIVRKNNQIKQMKQEITDLTDSKKKLALNTNTCLNQSISVICAISLDSFSPSTAVPVDSFLY